MQNWTISSWDGAGTIDISDGLRRTVSQLEEKYERKVNSIIVCCLGISFLNCKITFLHLCHSEASRIQRSVQRLPGSHFYVRHFSFFQQRKSASAMDCSDRVQFIVMNLKFQTLQLSIEISADLTDKLTRLVRLLNGQLTSLVVMQYVRILIFAALGCGHSLPEFCNHQYLRSG